MPPALRSQQNVRDGLDEQQHQPESEHDEDGFADVGEGGRDAFSPHHTRLASWPQERLLTNYFWDSTRNSPPFRDWQRGVESTIRTHPNGCELMSLVDHGLARNTERKNFVPKAILEKPSLFGLAPESGSSSPGESVSSVWVRSPRTSYDELSGDAKCLDLMLYSHIIRLVQGPKRDLLAYTTTGSFFQAWFLLHQDQVESNYRQKSECLARLDTLKFLGNPSEFESEALKLFTAVLDSKVSVWDLLANSLVKALPADGYDAIKLQLVNRIDSGDLSEINIRNLVSELVTSLALTKDYRPIRNANLANTQKRCHRCNRTGHERASCYAKRDDKGRPLTDPPPSVNPRAKAKEAALAETESKPSADQPEHPDDALTALIAAAARAAVREQLPTKDGQVAGVFARVDTAERSPSHRKPTQEFLDAVMKATIAKSIVSAQRAMTHQGASLHNHQGILDSGAGTHLHPKPQRMDTSRQSLIRGVSGDLVVTNGTGSVALMLQSDSGPVEVQISDVEQMNVHEPLWSLGLLIRNGYQFVARAPHSCYLLSPDNQRIAVRLTEGNIFVIPNCEDKTVTVSYASRKRVGTQTLHNAMGHISKQKLTETARHTKGFSDREIMASTDEACNSCMLGQSKRKPIGSRKPLELKESQASPCPQRLPTTSEEKRIIPLVREVDPNLGFDRADLKYAMWVALDIKFYPEMCNDGSTCNVTITELHSGAIWVIDMKTKSELFEAVKRVIVEEGWNKLDHVCTIFCDGEGVMANLKAREIELGVKVEHIPPYTPALNPAERAIQTLSRGAACMLIDGETNGLDERDLNLAFAAKAHCHLRTASGPHRGNKTPFELIKGNQPSIIHVRQFGSTCFVNLRGRDYRRSLKGSNGKILAHHNAEVGVFLGYYSLWGTHFLVRPSASKPGSKPIRSMHLDFAEPGVIAATLSGTGYVPSSGQLLELNCADEEQHPPLVLTQGPKDQEFEVESVLDHRVGENGEKEFLVRWSGYGEDDDTWEPAANLSGTAEEAIAEFLNETSREALKAGRFDLRDAFLQAEGGHSLRFRLPKHMKPDDDGTFKLHKVPLYPHEDENVARMVDCFTACETAMFESGSKDLNWKRALQSESKLKVMEALNKEKTALAKILTLIPDGHPEREVAERSASHGRYLLDRKRCGRWKARGVKTREDKRVDGPDFNYFARVARLVSLRTLVCRPDRHFRSLCARDISTAFLQSMKYAPSEPARYAKFRDPTTGEFEYFRQSGPIYGEASAPIRWEKTLAAALESAGFQRGQNDPSLYYNPETDVAVIVYVDDILADGDKAAVTEFMSWLETRFECREPEWLTIESPIQYIGIDIWLDSTHVHMSMSYYVEKLSKLLDIGRGRKVTSPITSDIMDDTPLRKELVKAFRSGLGGTGWLANTVRPDIAFAQSRISQHMANPTEGAYRALVHLMRYLCHYPNRGISAPIHGESEPVWRFFSDSDHGGNKELANRGRAQLGLLATFNGAPVTWKSTVSSTAVAHPKMTEAHADTSSGASEIFATSNASKEFLYVSYIIEELGLTPVTLPLRMEVDSTTAESFIKNTCAKTRLKHIDQRQNWVLALRDQSVIEPVHVGTLENGADYFTKIQGGEGTRRFAHMFMCDSVMPEE